jgi:hypothetical protein
LLRRARAVTRPETHYAKSGDVRIVYQVLGDGPIDVVFVQGFISTLAEGLSPTNAAELLAIITGALVVANALADTAAYDRAKRDLLSSVRPHKYDPRGPSRVVHMPGGPHI